jgi:cytochrome c-type biogenesis protein CcsB
MKKVLSFFFSMLFTGILLVIFAVSIGYATFIENDYGTITAKILIYNSWWFEALLLLVSVNLIGSVFVHKLIARKKWSVLVFHAAFVIILLGAALTRYFGYEGTIHIREGEESKKLISDATFVSITATGNNQSASISKEVKFSGYTGNFLKEKLQIAGKVVTIENLLFVPSAAETVVADPAGEPLVALVAVHPVEGRSDFVLRKGDIRNISGLNFSFGTEPGEKGVKIRESNEEIYISSPDTMYSFIMGGEKEDTIAAGTEVKFLDKTAYRIGTISFIIRQYVAKGKPQLVYVPSHEGTMKNDAFNALVTVGNESKEVIVFGSKGEPGIPYNVIAGNISVTISYGSLIKELPFSIKLNDFQLERYPGSNSPSSYASEVVLIDKTKGIEKPFRIFMNNILKYNGYRFFQSSFDQDEKGTILSVNHDPAGTMVTYFGYLILVAGMVFTFFNRNSRFKKLVAASAKLAAERKKLFPVMLIALSSLFTGNTFAQGNFSSDNINQAHAKKFGELLVQSNEGRIEPVNTVASEILRKVYKKSNYEGLSPVQVLLDMIVDPGKWKNTPFIKVSNPELKKILGITGNYATFSQILPDENSDTYLLKDQVNKAYEKKSSQRNKFDKEVLNVDERVNILYKVFTGEFLTLFPVPDDKNHKWENFSGSFASTNEAISNPAATFKNYLGVLKESKKTGNYSTSDELLMKIKNNQLENGKQVLPPMIKTKLEIFYINFNIFSKLAIIYVLVGFILLIFQFTILLRPSHSSGKPASIGNLLVLILFLIHSAGLGLRWYISGHAPWSNGYESLIYISWATCLAGLLFAKRSPVTLAVTTILSAITLFVAGMSWMNPELTNLVPVLKSYWLIIHVAIITASYGFFAMAAILGLFNLILMILRNQKNIIRVSFTIKELVVITQLAMMIGLIMLTVGSFIGGVWANESWGRYWGWDPKETWALVTVLVYSFITHMHKIPGFRGSFAISTGALIGLGSVLMTFFGVNYYLSGLHSYAQGDPAPVPKGVYIAIFVMFIIIISAYFSNRLSARTTGQTIELPGEE